jgi:ribonucleoside-diphosphate reductase alpha chain
MTNQNDISTLAKEAWIYDIPSNESCRLFLTENNGMPEQVWFLNNDGKVTDDLALFAKVLTLDLQQEMPNKVQEKLNMLASVNGQAFSMAFPPTGEKQLVRGQVSGIAKLLQYRAGFPMTDTPKLREQKTGDIWSVDVLNPYTQQTFTIKISEPMMDGRRCPSSIWLEGHNPEILDGLCALLSADMVSSDLSRIAIKLKSVLEPIISISGTEYRLHNFSSYIAYLLLGRYEKHFYMDKQINILSYRNVVSLDTKKSTNGRCFSHELEVG